MKLSLDPRRRRQFDQAGFIVIKNALSRTDLRRLNDTVDDLCQRFSMDACTGRLELRNCVAHDPLLLELSCRRDVLTAIVELLGPDVKLRTSEVDVRKPVVAMPGELGRNRWGEPEQWHVDGPILGFPTVNGILPLMEVRVGFYLTDLRVPGSGALCVVPGSHRYDYRALSDPKLRIPATSIHQVAVPAGTIILFRTGLWHCVTPNVSTTIRRVLYYAYTYRWVEPSDYVEQSPDLLARCTPVQRQLLGATATPDRLPLGENSDQIPCSFYWFTRPEDLPVASWAQVQRARARPVRSKINQ